MSRHGFSHRRTTTKKKKNLSSKDSLEAITRSLLDTRVFQQEVPEIRETMVYNRDQVPMAMARSYSTTVDDKNNDIIQDATFDSEDVKRFCTLNLTIPMTVEDDLRNLVRPHLVFKATNFKAGENQEKKTKEGQLERELQDERVDVSFQANA